MLKEAAKATLELVIQDYLMGCFDELPFEGKLDLLSDFHDYIYNTYFEAKHD